MKTCYFTLWATVLIFVIHLNSAKAQLVPKRSKQPQKEIAIQKWRTLVNHGRMLAGSSNAPVTLVEFSDFQCPHCAKFEQTLTKYLKKHPHQLRVIIIYFPLPQHRWAREAAKQADGVAHYGDFETFVKLLYKNQDKFSSQPWDSLAKLAGVKNLKALHQYVHRKSLNNKIQKDMRLGISVGLRQTPTIIINRKFYSGELSYQELQNAVREAQK
ncbi:MAG TPA: thioredoxin domain-containing protein [Balneolaceae bacterium]|nr:thioredoxin domain-containing protein [Balneolaceae bacterium]